MYTGSTTRISSYPEYGFAGSVVVTLMNGMFDQGHTLYIDNWYSSPKLFKILHEKRTNVCGTVRMNRKFMPKFTSELRKGQHESFVANNMMCLRWKDRREVRMLTTFHGDDFVVSGKKDIKTGQEIMIPACEKDYNNHMGAVDKTDMLLSSVECVRKTVKWYKKLFFHFMDLSLIHI